MLRPKTCAAARRGNTLIVTLLLLGLLAVVGLATLYNARDIAQNAQIRAQAIPEFNDDGMGAFNTFLSSWIYDVPDSGPGLLNALRGHSLMATMYGRQPGAVTPWNGVGSIPQAVLVPGEAGPIPRSFVVNHAAQLNGPVWFHPEYADPQAPGLPPAGTLYPKNAPYTYPDMKDFYLAVQCPATGEILAPSFFRYPSPNSVFGSLAPNNPKWLSPSGLYETVRPTRLNHPNFPAVPQNPDGTFTGDVQNLPGAFALNGHQRNDSIWIDIGLKPITLPGGKKVKPLVAPLILDLDGRLNLSVHGNLLAAGQHASGAGLGPWEINLERVIGLEGRQLVQRRGAPQTGAGGPAGTRKSFASRYPANTQLPTYSRVPWVGNAGAHATSLNLPGTSPGSLYTGAPLYGPGYDDTNNPTNFPNHPSLFNPSEWPTADPGPRAFKLADNKFLTARYSGAPSFHALLDAGSSAPGTLRGPDSATNMNPPNSVANSHRTNPAHPNRLLFTTYGYGLDRVGLSNGQTAEPFAQLGAVDVNRKLADYRNDTTLPLSPTNMGNHVQAEADRQQLAKDIFVRLLIASGPSNFPGVSVDVTTGDYVLPLVLPPALLDPLRQLAQVAANIVDFVDNDDISTRFLWNPTGASLGESTVFGVEKPRLVLNEAYSEVTNDPNDPTFTPPPDPLPVPAASNPAHVRFWIELQNPCQTPYSGVGAATNPLGDGSVRLRYSAAELGTNPPIAPYRIEIVRDNKVAGNSVANLFKDKDGNPSNVTGSPDILAAPDLIFDFSPADGTPQRIVSPANGAANGGIVVCAAHVPAVRGPEFSPGFANAINGTPAVPLLPAAVPSGALGYTLPLASAFNSTQHVVLLRRLANPYLPFNPVTNPYITVDTITNVRCADRVLRTAGMTTDRPARTTAAGPGYEPNTPPAMAGDPELRPQSTGKVQPYAAWAQFGTAAAPPTFPNSMILYQEPSVVGVGVNGVRHTFFRQNSRAAAVPVAPTVNHPIEPTALSDTLMVPFDWLVHLDRPLINQTELLHVSTGKTHDLTMQFIKPTGGMPNAARKFEGTAQAALLSLPNIYRALELLRVQPYGHMTAAGGRVPGRINLNTIQDKRVWDALFDAQDTNAYTQTDVDNWWNLLIGSRTRTIAPRPDAQNPSVTHPTPVPSQTIYDTNAATNLAGTPADRPILPFGIATHPTLYGGIGIQDTLLRGTPLPFLTVPPSATVVHPYQYTEGLRKILNNVTTVSHTFAVFVTVGYFEVENEIPSSHIMMPNGTPAMFTQLGREYYRNVPGDTRHKFFAIVDRSTIGLDPAAFVTGTPLHAQTLPFFTTLEQNAPVGSTILSFAASGAIFVSVNGSPVGIGSTLVVGTGSRREIVNVTGMIYANGIVEATINPPLTRPHYAGESVSNVIPGNPGPQPNFDVNASMYRAVVPYWSRLP
jgi:hypothetical protein